MAQVVVGFFAGLGALSLAAVVALTLAIALSG